MDIVTLKTKEQLDIFMSPQRQRLLRALAIAPAPQTPKALSAKLGVSPSSVQHHLKKLESIGLVRLDHTELMRGITAKFYAATNVTVRIGLVGEASFPNERAALLRTLVAAVLDDTLADCFEQSAAKPCGDVLTGAVHLPPARAAELEGLIRDFLRENAAPAADAEPWEYALIYRSAKKQV